MIRRVCRECGIIFNSYPSWVKGGKGKCCSKNCSDIFQKEKHWSLETEIKKGQRFPEYWKEAMKGRDVWNKGTKGLCKPNKTSFKPGQRISKETEFKPGQYSLSKHFNWQGGKSFEPYPLGWNKTFKEQVRYRDGYRCQVCGIPEIESGRKLDVHHIDYDKENLTVRNLTVLCKSCHMKTNYNRIYWQQYFKEVMSCAFSFQKLVSPSTSGNIFTE